MYVQESQEYVRLGETNKVCSYLSREKLLCNAKMWLIVVCQLKLSIANFASLAHSLKVGGLANLVV